MSTGADACGDAFVEAMRARLAAEGHADNVDREDVKKNLYALGSAVFHIVGDLSVSDASADAAFWQWVAATQGWLVALSTWQKGVTTALSAWAPTLPAEQALKAALLGLAAPGDPPATAPTQLHVRVP